MEKQNTIREKLNDMGTTGLGQWVCKAKTDKGFHFRRCLAGSVIEERYGYGARSRFFTMIIEAKEDLNIY